MFTALVVDDNPIHCQAVVDRFDACPLACELNVETCPSIEDLRVRMNAGSQPDILVMDIQFAGTSETGIDAVKDLIPRSAPVQVIFITSHIEYCTPVYETRHVWFLTKPVSQADFDKAIDRAVSNLKRLALKPLVLRYNGELNVIPIHLIRYIEAERRLTEVHMGNTVVETYTPLKELMSMLPDRFVPSHKSYLVNLDWVTRVASTEVELKGGEKVPLSVRRRAAFCRALEDYVMEF